MNKLQHCALSYFYDDYINDEDFETTLELIMDEDTEHQFKKNPWFAAFTHQEMVQLIENLYQHMIRELGVQR